jgi:general stress protein YciG
LFFSHKKQLKRRMIMSNKNPNKHSNQASGTSARGFASMPHEKVQEIASKGGHASAEKAGHEGMSERGHKGGEARAEQLGHEGYVELGHKGGSAPHSSRPGRAGNEQDEGNNGNNQTSASKSGSGRGFASQPKEKVAEAGRKGGQHSHGGSRSSSS